MRKPTRTQMIRRIEEAMSKHDGIPVRIVANAKRHLRTEALTRACKFLDYLDTFHYEDNRFSTIQNQRDSDYREALKVIEADRADYLYITNKCKEIWGLA
jgi:hypothetical protein